MNELIEKEKIENMIYKIRGVEVMLDSDLAKLYGVETKRINEAVKNNIEKFPERYCFQLNDKESNNLRSKISTSKINSHGGRRYNQRVFTEQGVYMLATILKSRVASEITIAIMDAFVIMKNIINTSLIEQKYINSLVLEHDNEIRLLQESFNKLSTKEKINHIFYNGQIYDAYSLLIDILNKAKKEIIIIDNYAGKELFDITKDIKVNIKIYTKNIDEISKKKYMQEYSNIEIITIDIFHDRFIILDKNKLYSCGSSFKDLGKKCFAINEFDDMEYLNRILEILI